MSTKIISLYPCDEEIISAAEYLNRWERGDESIKNAEILPPRIGSKSFGSFKVKNSKMVYGYAKKCQDAE